MGKKVNKPKTIKLGATNSHPNRDGPNTRWPNLNSGSSKLKKIDKTGTSNLQMWAKNFALNHDGHSLWPRVKTRNTAQRATAMNALHIHSSTLTPTWWVGVKG
jgi:hypothetical protein